MAIFCPLCLASEPELLEDLDGRQLSALWSGAFGDEILKEFEPMGRVDFYLCPQCDLRFFQPSEGGSPHFYEILQTLPWYYMQDKNEYEVAKRFVPEEASVLEVGAGKGAFARKIKTSRYVGLEFNPTAIAAAAAEGVKVFDEFVEQHAATHGGQYDVVCSFQVLEHVARTRSFVQAALDCLKPGGLLIYSVPAEDSYVSLLPNSILNMPPHHMTRWSDKALRKLADLFRLEMVHLEHDILCPEHKPAYAYLLSLRVISSLLRRPVKTIDASLPGRIISRAASRLGKLLTRALDDPKLLPRGHSVTVIYRKGSDADRGTETGDARAADVLTTGPVVSAVEVKQI